MPFQNLFILSLHWWWFYIIITAVYPSRHPTHWALRKGDTLSLACRAMEAGHLLHSALTCLLNANALHLKLRHPFGPDAQLISVSDNNNIHAALWADHWLKAKWLENPTRHCTFSPDAGTYPLRMALPRTVLVHLNHFNTSVGCFYSYSYKWGMVSSATWHCQAD